MYLPLIQMVSNQIVGSVIAAVIQNATMMRAQAIPGMDYRPNIYWLNTIPLTATLQEVYQLSAEVTQHAVESGTIFSDHVILNPIRVEIEFEVGNFDGLGSRAQLAKQSLAEAIKQWRGRGLFTLITTHTSLDNMVCLAIRAVNEAPNWGRLSFRATFQQVKVATLQVQSFPTGQVQGGPPDNAAPQAATPPGGPVTPKSAMDSASPRQIQPRAVSPSAPLFSPKASSPVGYTPPLVNHGASGSWGDAIPKSIGGQ